MLICNNYWITRIHSKNSLLHNSFPFITHIILTWTWKFWIIPKRKREKENGRQLLAILSKYWLTMLQTPANFTVYKMIVGFGLPRVIKGKYLYDLISCQEEPSKPGEAERKITAVQNFCLLSAIDIQEVTFRECWVCGGGNTNIATINYSPFPGLWEQNILSEETVLRK